LEPTIIADGDDALIWISMSLRLLLPPRLPLQLQLQLRFRFQLQLQLRILQHTTPRLVLFSPFAVDREEALARMFKKREERRAKR
jgi:hypothetical protein